MRSAFWPRCQVEGSIITQQGPVDFKGRGMFAHALQGMKPHFAAAKFNFVNFQSPTYSAILSGYTTPKSYGETVVDAGGIAIEGGILIAGATPAVKAVHTEIKGDPDNDWPEPGAITFTWTGKTQDGKDVTAKLEGSILPRTDRIDVMGELPKFVKQIVAGAAGTKPYIYQVNELDRDLWHGVCADEKIVHAQAHAQAQYRRRGEGRGGFGAHRSDLHIVNEVFACGVNQSYPSSHQHAATLLSHTVNVLCYMALHNQTFVSSFSTNTMLEFLNTVRQTKERRTPSANQACHVSEMNLLNWIYKAV